MLTYLFYLLFCYTPPVQNTYFSIEISDLKSNKGHVGLLLFDSDKGYPDNPKFALRAETVSIQNKKAIVVVRGLEIGKKYAAIAVHDENDSGNMDFNIIGVPTEGMSISNDAMGLFRPKPFKDAAFTFVQSGQLQQMKMHYY